MCCSAIEVDRPLRAEDTLTIVLDMAFAMIKELQAHAVAATERIQQ
jgi:hypothetical protein